MDLTPLEFEMNNNGNENTQTKTPFDRIPNGPLVIPQCYLQNRNIPAIYMKIWENVRSTTSMIVGNEFCDQDKLYKTLLLTDLNSDTLAKVWSFVNRTVPGQLTRNELIVMLGIIALLQQNDSSPIEHLYQMSSIPSPVFKSDITNTSQVLENFDEHKSGRSTNNPLEDFADFQSAKFDDVCHTKSQTNSFLLTNDTQIIDPIQDKYSYFRDIEISQTEEMSKSNHDEFGDFLSYDKCIEKSTKNLSILDSSSPITQFDILNTPNLLLESFTQTKKNNFDIQSKFLTSYKKILSKIFNTLFINNNEETIIEAFNTEDGHNFILDLLEIHNIYDRLSVSETISKDETFNDIFNDLNSLWKSITNLLNKSNLMNINFKDKNNSLKHHPDSDNGEICLICISKTHGQTDSLSFGGVYYHYSCANFWLNFVENTLPS